MSDKRRGLTKDKPPDVGGGHLFVQNPSNPQLLGVNMASAPLLDLVVGFTEVLMTLWQSQATKTRIWNGGIGGVGF